MTERNLRLRIRHALCACLPGCHFSPGSCLRKQAFIIITGPSLKIRPLLSIVWPPPVMKLSYADACILWEKIKGTVLRSVLWENSHLCFGGGAAQEEMTWVPMRAH